MKGFGWIWLGFMGLMVVLALANFNVTREVATGLAESTMSGEPITTSGITTGAADIAQRPITIPVWMLVALGLFLWMLLK